MSSADTYQHYVSQFLLRGFHAGSKVQIWAFDKLTGRSFTTGIKDVACEHGFYNIGDSAELDEFIRKFEAATAPVVEEIKTRGTLAGLSEDKRIRLSGFTALQYVRTKAYSERSQDMMRQITHVVTQASGKLSKEVERQLGLDAPGSEHEKTLSTIHGLVRLAAEKLWEKTLVLYRGDGSMPFWVGDSPVAINNTINPGDGLRSTLGLSVPGIEVYLPINSELILAHMCPSITSAYIGLDESAHRMGFIHAYARPYLQALEHVSSIRVGKEEIRFQNSLQLGYSERFVFSCADCFDDAREILAKNPRLKKGPRYGRSQRGKTPASRSKG